MNLYEKTTLQILLNQKTESFSSKIFGKFTNPNLDHQESQEMHREVTQIWLENSLCDVNKGYPGWISIKVSFLPIFK